MHDYLQNIRSVCLVILITFYSLSFSLSLSLLSQELMSAVSSRIPSPVEEAIQKSLAHYASNITSVLNQFPSVQIVNIINRHAASITKRTDHDQFFMNTSPIVQLVQK